MLPSGNIPASLSKGDDELVQFCHGAPGIIPCLTLIKRLYPGERATHLSSYAEKLAKCVWERGLLCKSVGLCHGISGNAFAFLELYSADPQNSDYLNQAAAFCRFACNWRDHTSRKMLKVPDHPYSLFQGNAGLAWLLIDLWWTIQPEDQRPNTRERPCGFPCFTDLH